MTVVQFVPSGHTPNLSDLLRGIFEVKQCRNDFSLGHQFRGMTFEFGLAVLAPWRTLRTVNPFFGFWQDSPFVFLQTRSVVDTYCLQ